jgi:hypothetical protein
VLVFSGRHGSSLRAQRLRGSEAQRLNGLRA